MCILHDINTSRVGVPRLTGDTHTHTSVTHLLTHVLTKRERIRGKCPHCALPSSPVKMTLFDQNANEVSSSTLRLLWNAVRGKDVVVHQVEIEYRTQCVDDLLYKRNIIVCFRFVTRICLDLHGGIRYGKQVLANDLHTCARALRDTPRDDSCVCVRRRCALLNSVGRAENGLKETFGPVPRCSAPSRRDAKRARRSRTHTHTKRVRETHRVSNIIIIFFFAY